MQDKKHFHFISDFGKSELPCKPELSQIAEAGERILLVLDSSVCLDIVSLVRDRKSSGADKIKIFNLIEYVQKNKTDWTPIFALIESCYDRTTLDLKQDKLFDYKNKIDFAFKYPIKVLKKFQYDFNLNYKVFPQPKIEQTSIAIIINERIKIHYAALLKIYQISLTGLNRESAERNIEAFVNWMVDDLDILLGIEYRLALNIFGGDPNFRSMLKLGSSKEKCFKACWGTAWDLFHARVSCNRDQLSSMIGGKVRPIFVTKDGRLFELLAPQIDTYFKYNSSKISISTNVDYQKNYTDSFMNYLNERMEDLRRERIHKSADITQQKLDQIIQDLEKSIS
jgi:hypothetical protein